MHIILGIGALVVCILYFCLVWIWIPNKIEETIDFALKETQVVELVKLADEDSSLELLTQRLKEYDYKISALQTENLELKQAIDAKKNNIEAIFKVSN